MHNKETTDYYVKTIYYYRQNYLYPFPSPSFHIPDKNQNKVHVKINLFYSFPFLVLLTLVHS